RNTPITKSLASITGPRTIPRKATCRFPRGRFQYAHAPRTVATAATGRPVVRIRGSTPMVQLNDRMPSTTYSCFGSGIASCLDGLCLGNSSAGLDPSGWPGTRTAARQAEQRPVSPARWSGAETLLPHSGQAKEIGTGAPWFGRAARPGADKVQPATRAGDSFSLAQDTPQRSQTPPAAGRRIRKAAPGPDPSRRRRGCLGGEGRRRGTPGGIVWQDDAGNQGDDGDSAQALPCRGFC